MAIRSIKYLICAFIIQFGTVHLLAAEEKPNTRVIERKSMNFRQCLGMISSLGAKYGAAPKSIFRTDQVSIVQFDPDGGDGMSYVLSCTRSNETMQINEVW